MPAKKIALNPRQMGFRRDFGDRIRHVREAELQMTVEEMSKALEMSGSWVGQIEHAYQGCDVVYLKDIIDLSHMPASYFFTGKIDVPRAPRTLIEWEQMYPDQPVRARVHFDIEAAFDTDRRK